MSRSATADHPDRKARKALPGHRGSKVLWGLLVLKESKVKSVHKGLLERPEFKEK